MSHFLNKDGVYVQRTFANDENFALQAAYIARNTYWSRNDIVTMDPADLDAFTSALQAIVNEENMEDAIVFEPDDGSSAPLAPQVVLDN